MTDDQTAGTSVGAELRLAREASGLTVEQVSASTKIRATLVRDLEADRFDSSGGDFYARGHLRALAAVVGADAAALVAHFDRADAAAPTPELFLEAVAPVSSRVAVLGAPLGAHSAGRVERRGPNWALAGMAAVAVLVGLVVIGSVRGGSTTTNTDAFSASLAPAPSSSPASSASAAVVPPAPDAVAQKPPATGAELRVRIIGGQSWISVSNATGRLFEGVLGDGEFKDFTDPDQLKLVVGNAGAVNLVCGGKDVGQAGDSGRVKRFSCSATGLVAG